MDIELNNATYRNVTGIELFTNFLEETSYLTISSGNESQTIRGEYQELAVLLEQCRAAGFSRVSQPAD